jgi:hypothetical protein
MAFSSGFLFNNVDIGTNFQTTDQVKTSIESYGYQDLSNVKAKIESYGYQDLSNVKAKIESYGYQDLSNVKAKIESYGYQDLSNVKAKIESYGYQDLSNVKAKIESYGYYTRGAYTDLNFVRIIGKIAQESPQGYAILENNQDHNSNMRTGGIDETFPNQYAMIIDTNGSIYMGGGQIQITSDFRI